MTTSWPYDLLTRTPQTPTSSIVAGKDEEPKTDWGNSSMYRSNSDLFSAAIRLHEHLTQPIPQS